MPTERRQNHTPGSRRSARHCSVVKTRAKANRGRGVFDPQALLRIEGSMRQLGSLFAKPGLGEPGGLYDAREACLINEIDLSYELVLAKLVE